MAKDIKIKPFYDKSNVIVTNNKKFDKYVSKARKFTKDGKNWYAFEDVYSLMYKYSRFNIVKMFRRFDPDEIYTVEMDTLGYDPYKIYFISEKLAYRFVPDYLKENDKLTK
jgi:hypothetical protein